MSTCSGKVSPSGSLYRAFGLNLSSDLDFPEFHRSTASCVDLRITQASIPWVERPDDLFISNTSPPEVTLRVEGIVRMQVRSDGLHYQRLDDASDHALRHILADTGLGLVLLLRSTPPLHASAVRLPQGGAVAFCGMQGAGKSTLSAALDGRGYPKLADDIAALVANHAGELVVQPGVGYSKLLSDALERLDIAQHGLQNVSGKHNKFLVPLDLWQTAEPLRYVVELCPGGNGPVSLVPVQGVEKISLLDKHTFGSEVMHLLGLRGMHIQWLTRLAAQVPVYRLSRPQGRDSLGELVDTLESLWATPAGNSTSV